MMRTVSQLTVALALAAGLAGFAGCQRSTGTAPGPIDLTSTTEYFTGILDPNASVTFTVTILKTEYTQVTLLTETTNDPNAPITAPLNVRLGTSTGTGCTPIEDTTTTPGFKAQIGRVLEAGIYCVEVFDTGTLPEIVNVLVRVVHPAPIVRPRPGTETAASNIFPGGSVERTFEATAPGVARVTLTSLDPNVPVGMGIGVQFTDEDGTECRANRVITTTPSSTPQFTVDVDPGTYCVRIFDLGNFTGMTTFGLTVQRP